MGLLVILLIIVISNIAANTYLAFIMCRVLCFSLIPFNPQNKNIKQLCLYPFIGEETEI